MEILSCYHCGSSDRDFYAEENGFTLVKCRSCGLLYVKDRPDDNQISDAHKQGKHRGDNDFDITGRYSNAKANNYLTILKDLFESPNIQPCRWLDVGCGHGEFVGALQEYFGENVKCTGSEPNINKQKSATDRGLNVTYFDLANHNEKYDTISLLNVYSHIPNPPEFFALLKSILNTGGELIVQTGDSAHFTAKEHYKPFTLPDHLSFASLKIISEMLEKQGFEIIKVCKYPYVPLEPMVIVKEIIKLFLPSYRSRFKYYLNWKKYSATDMYIRAKLIKEG